jgi:hypothetical protein
MTAKQVMAELESLGSPGIKKIRIDYQLAKELYATGNADAQYFAGLIADDSKMTRADLQMWVKGALSQNISEYTVPWVAAGWSTLANLVSLIPDDQLDLGGLRTLLARAAKEIHKAPNRVT